MVRAILACVALFVTGVVVEAQGADIDKAWQALNNLDIKTARPLFEKTVAKNPKDLLALRGLLLSAYFDLDNGGQVRAMEQMVAADSSDPHLMGVFEHTAALLDGHAKQLPLRKLLGDAMVARAGGGMLYTGEDYLQSWRAKTCSPATSDSRTRMGSAPGAWVLGPFDNRSNIAAYREVWGEHDRLDTLAVTTGKQGYRAAWGWVNGDQYGNVDPGNSFGRDSNFACQVRCFFKLPTQQSVQILMSGAYSGRILLDGFKISDDATYRNASRRGGFRVTLDAGAHEVEAVVGAQDQGLIIEISVTDTSYLPIPGLEWMRYAEVKPAASLAATNVHPIFDPYDSWAAKAAPLPDTRFWSTVLRIYNGYAPEVVRELEALESDQKISLLEKWLLYRALLLNQERERALQVLSSIHDQANNPQLAADWANNTVTSIDERIKAFDSLSTLYPNRMELELLAGMRPLLNRDLKGLIDGIKKVQAKYPDDASIHLILSMFNTQATGDAQASYDEMLAYCRGTQDKRTEMQRLPWLLYKLGRFDESIDLLKEWLAAGPTVYEPVSEMNDILSEVNRAPELLPLLDSLAKVYPNNALLHALLSTIYSHSGQNDKNKAELAAIHRLKPTAVLPWQSLDSLHHNVSYDSIFGSVDVLSLWDVTPTPVELAGGDKWKLLNRVQKIVFADGVAVDDFHMAWVLLNQKAVSDYQSYDLGFTPGEGFYGLQVARRLRKGQPPLEAERQGGQLVFKDLKPGDAIEIHYRRWEGRGGDLWKDFWDEYKPLRNIYQRSWEYTIYTDRSDLKYLAVPPAKEPVATTRFGFKKLTWAGQKTPGVRLDADLLPPSDEVLGSIYITTIKDWEVIRKWYRSISDAVLADNPRTDKLCKEIVAGKNSDKEKLEALYSYVALQIPYQTIGFDYDGSIPRRPDECLLNQWGDCKDKTHLAVGLFRKAGLNAWPVLVLTKSDGSRMPMPQFSFDHEIIGCLIDGDTVFIDPSDLTAGPYRTITATISGQPFLPIGPNPVMAVGSLPKIPADQYHTDTRLAITVSDTGSSRFTCARTCYNVSAGNRRDALRGKSVADLMSSIGTDFSSSWGTSMTLDTLMYDSVETVDSVFHEVWGGQMRLNVSEIGTTRLVSMPDWSNIPTSMPADLMIDQVQSYPVVLDGSCGTYNKTLVLTVPESFGEPQVAKAVSVSDSLYSFSSNSVWDKEKHTLTLDYRLVVNVGRCDRKAFAGFANSAIKAYKTPILFQQL